MTEVPLKDPRKKKLLPRLPLSASPGPAFWASLLGGSAVFFTTVSIYCFEMFYHFNAIMTLTCILLVNATAWLLLQKRGFLRCYENLGPFASVPVIAAYVAIVSGVLFGLLIYFAYGRSATVYAAARTYENVVPSAPAGTFSDAGRLLFADEAYVDIELSVGYSDDDGNKYCVAAIRDETVARHVQFLAVGYNCCGLKSSFTCDAVGKQGGGGGVVVYDKRGFFQGGAATRQHFEASQRKLESTFDLKASKEVVYIKWLTMEEAKTFVRSYRTKAWVCIALATFAYAVACGAIVWIGLKPYAI